MEFYGLTLFSEHTHTHTHRGLIQRRERQLMTLAPSVSGGDSTLHKTNFSRVAVHSHPLLPFFKKYILFVVLLRRSEAKKTKRCINIVRCEALFVLCPASPVLRGWGHWNVCCCFHKRSKREAAAQCLCDEVLNTSANHSGENKSCSCRAQQQVFLTFGIKKWIYLHSCLSTWLQHRGEII